MCKGIFLRFALILQKLCTYLQTLQKPEKNTFYLKNELLFPPSISNVFSSCRALFLHNNKSTRLKRELPGTEKWLPGKPGLHKGVVRVKATKLQEMFTNAH